MNRRERLLATLEGKTVDRPPVSFYELNGLDEDPSDPDPFNIYADPSWQPLIRLAREETDRIVMRGVAFKNVLPDPVDEIADIETFQTDNTRVTIKRIRVGSRTLTSRTRRDLDINTIWTEEHLLKGVQDLELFLEIPQLESHGDIDPSAVLEAEAVLGDSGIIMIDTPDPLCLAASLFEMGEYTVIARTCPRLFRRLLDPFADRLHRITDLVSEALPGRLWRIYGPEYASPPFLPPQLFTEYVVAYDQPMVDAIHRHRGYARLHAHGNLKRILDAIAGMGVDGLDPIEPPPQGDVELRC